MPVKSKMFSVFTVENECWKGESKSEGWMLWKNLKETNKRSHIYPHDQSVEVP